MHTKMYTSDLSIGTFLISPISGAGALGHLPRCFKAGQLCCSCFPPVISFMYVVRGVRFLSWTTLAMSFSCFVHQPIYFSLIASTFKEVFSPRQRSK